MSSLTTIFNIRLFRSDLIKKFVDHLKNSSEFLQFFSVNTEQKYNTVQLSLRKNFDLETHMKLMDKLSEWYYNFCKEHNISFSCRELASRKLSGNPGYILTEEEIKLFAPVLSTWSKAFASSCIALC